MSKHTSNTNAPHGPYYIGLDCGTNSVGWAVTDEEYHLLRARGKTLYGSRLFEEAQSAEARRIARSARRRIRRSADRIKLLNILFSPEMSKIDPEFYFRLKKSFLLEDDKKLTHNSKNTLFNDPDFQDKDFHRAYPTIWHLRKAIVTAATSAQPAQHHFDLRLYYLAIHHILRNRGHFLREGPLKGAGNFEQPFIALCDVANSFGLNVDEAAQSSLEKILKSRTMGIKARRRAILDSIFLENDEAPTLRKRQDEFAGLIAGSKITPLKIFEDEVSKDAQKLSFATDSFDDHLAELEKELSPDQLQLLESAKQVYDYGYLTELLGGEEYIAMAMVNHYNTHQQELQELKRLLKPFPDDYRAFFQTKEAVTQKEVFYNAYIGQAYVAEKSGRKKSYRVSQADINKEIKTLLEKHQLQTDLLVKAERGELLPKQRGQAKGTIPQQLHHNELELILKQLALDYPSFGRETSEPLAYNTICKKIASIHSFRIPYYCGPLVKRSIDADGRPVVGGKSQFSWADDEIATLVRPWNFNEVVNLDARANNFIRRMTNKCTYLPSEDVLPKASLLYQKYMVLNELNNLKINGQRLADVKVKQAIYQRGFINGELIGNITLKTLGKWLRDNGFLTATDELSGTAESKFLPKLTTHLDFHKILGPDYTKQYSADQLETAIELITILSNEPSMLEDKLLDTLHCTSDQASKLARRKYSDWAKFSGTLLTDIRAEVNGRRMSIMDMLMDTNYNFMELLGNKMPFMAAIQQFNQLKNPAKTDITYEDVKNLYCHPSVKRTIWQAIKIIDEIVKVEGAAPAKIFIESTRTGDDKKRGQETLSRHHQLLDLYTKMKKSDDVKALISELKSREPRDLQSKKFYLYFTQMGRCAYTGERIDLEELFTKAYDIDHIYPRSKTKDDSITRNLVLVKAKYNREKTNEYPINADWRQKMHGLWTAWRNAGLITQEKYNRLTRSTPLTAEELAGFIARQLVETSQSTKALHGLLTQKYPNTKIVLVKAGQVHNIRQYFAQGYCDQETGAVIVPGRPEFIKVRELNDLHHAKDAYLNIVVGNVMSQTFTDNPIRWLKDPAHHNYSLTSHNIWRSKPRPNDFIKGWHYADSIKIISDVMKRNDALWTRMVHEQTGAISDLQLVGKNDDTSGILPAKKGLNPAKYGGYRSLSGAHFALIECDGKKGATARRLVPVPQIYVHSLDQYVANNFSHGKIIISRIPYKSLIKIDGFPVLISRKGSDVAVGFYHGIQVFFPPDICQYIKNIVKVTEKDLQLHGKYEITPEIDKVSIAENGQLLDAFMNKLEVFRKMPELGSKIDEIKMHSLDFMSLDLKSQCQALYNFLNIFTSGPTTANLQSFVPKAGTVGKGKFNDNIMQYDAVELILQSPTGLYERRINLKTCPPQNLGNM